MSEETPVTEAVEHPPTAVEDPLDVQPSSADAVPQFESVPVEPHPETAPETPDAQAIVAEGVVVSEDPDVQPSSAGAVPLSGGSADNAPDVQPSSADATSDRPAEVIASAQSPLSSEDVSSLPASDAAPETPEAQTILEEGGSQPVEAGVDLADADAAPDSEPVVAPAEAHSASRFGGLISEESDVQPSSVDAVPQPGAAADNSPDVQPSSSNAVPQRDAAADNSPDVRPSSAYVTLDRPAEVIASEQSPLSSETVSSLPASDADVATPEAQTILEEGGSQPVEASVGLADADPTPDPEPVVATAEAHTASQFGELVSEDPDVQPSSADAVPQRDAAADNSPDVQPSSADAVPLSDGSADNAPDVQPSSADATLDRPAEVIASAQVPLNSGDVSSLPPSDADAETPEAQTILEEGGSQPVEAGVDLADADATPDPEPVVAPGEAHSALQFGGLISEESDVQPSSADAVPQPDAAADNSPDLQPSSADAVPLSDASADKAPDVQPSSADVTLDRPAEVIASAQAPSSSEDISPVPVADAGAETPEAQTILAEGGSQPFEAGVDLADADATPDPEPVVAAAEAHSASQPGGLVSEESDVQPSSADAVPQPGAAADNSPDVQPSSADATLDDPVEAIKRTASTPSPETAPSLSPSDAATDSGSVDAEELVISIEPIDTDRVRIKATIEAVIYITDEPLSAQQIATGVRRPIDEVVSILEELTAEYAQPDRGLSIREVAGGYKLGTKPEHHEAIRAFVKNLKPPLKLSLAALETLAVIAYKQPITAPEIMEIRGVQGAGVLKTLLDRKLIATAGRKNVIGKPILYKTTKEFLVQFGLKDLAELPTLKEFEELGRLALTDADAEPTSSPMKEPEPKPPIHDPGIGEPPVREPSHEPTPIEEPPETPEEPEPPKELGSGIDNG